MNRVVGFLMLLLAGMGAFLLASMMGSAEASPAGVIFDLGNLMTGK